MIRMKSAINVIIAGILFSGLIVVSPALNPPPIEWERAYGEETWWGGSRGEYIWQTPDGGFIIIGGNDSDDSNSQLIKIDSQGTLLWVKDLSLNGSSVPTYHVNDFQLTTEGNFILLMKGFILITMNQSGGVMWERRLRDEGYNDFSSLTPIAGGGYILAGPGFASGENNISLMSTEQSGTVIWDKLIQGTTGYRYEVSTIVQVTGGDILIAANRITSERRRHITLIRTDQRGEEIWEKEYGEGTVQGIYKTNDGRFNLFAYSTDNRGSILLLRIDKDGTLIWKKIIGGEQMVETHSIQPTDDGGYILAGDRGLILKITENGEIIWDRTFSNLDLGAFAVQTSDGGYILVGTRVKILDSGKGDMAHAISNVYVVKLASDSPNIENRTMTTVIPPESMPTLSVTTREPPTTIPGFIWSGAIIALVALIFFRLHR